MSFVLFCLFSPLITFLSHCLVERTLFKVFKPRSPQNALVKFLLLISAVYGVIAIAGWYQSDWTFLDLATLFVFTFMTTLGFGYAYFHFFNMSETARRIHILSLLFEASDLGDAKAKKELDAYDANKMILVRIERMIQMGALEIKDGKYQTQRGGLALSGLIFRKLRPLFYGK